MEDGYEFYFDRKLVTVFSAPNYCGEFDNAGAMMTVNDKMLCSFKLLKPVAKQMNAVKRVSQMPKSRSVSNPNRVSFGRVSVDLLMEKEKQADRKSFFHKSYFSDPDASASQGLSLGADFTVVQISTEPPKVIEIEDLTRRETSWGDIWEDLFWDEEQLAEFKYEAYEEELARMEAEGM